MVVIDVYGVVFLLGNFFVEMFGVFDVVEFVYWVGIVSGDVYSVYNVVVMLWDNGEFVWVVEFYEFVNWMGDLMFL